MMAKQTNTKCDCVYARKPGFAVHACIDTALNPERWLDVAMHPQAPALGLTTQPPVWMGAALWQ